MDKFKFKWITLILTEWWNIFTTMFFPSIQHSIFMDSLNVTIFSFTTSVQICIPIEELEPFINFDWFWYTFSSVIYIFLSIVYPF